MPLEPNELDKVEIRRFVKYDSPEPATKSISAPISLSANFQLEMEAHKEKIERVT